MRRCFSLLAIFALTMTISLPALAGDVTPVAADAPVQAASEVPEAGLPEAEAGPAAALPAVLELSSGEEHGDCNDYFGQSCSTHGETATCVFPDSPVQYPVFCWCRQGSWLCGI